MVDPFIFFPHSTHLKLKSHFLMTKISDPVTNFLKNHNKLMKKQKNSGNKCIYLLEFLWSMVWFNNIVRELTFIFIIYFIIIFVRYLVEMSKHILFYLFFFFWCFQITYLKIKIKILCQKVHTNCFLFSSNIWFFLVNFTWTHSDLLWNHRNISYFFSSIIFVFYFDKAFSLIM